MSSGRTFTHFLVALDALFGLGRLRCVPLASGASQLYQYLASAPFTAIGVQACPNLTRIASPNYKPKQTIAEAVPILDGSDVEKGWLWREMSGFVSCLYVHNELDVPVATAVHGPNRVLIRCALFLGHGAS